jgi:hypothetical protein
MITNLCFQTWVVQDCFHRPSPISMFLGVLHANRQDPEAAEFNSEPTGSRNGPKSSSANPAHLEGSRGSSAMFLGVFLVKRQDPQAADICSFCEDCNLSPPCNNNS